MNLEIKQSKCFIDGANVALYPNKDKPTLKNIKMVINELKNYFDLNPVSIYVIWKPVLRHHLPDEEKDELSKLEKQGILIQSFQGPGSTDDTLLLKYAEEFINKGDIVYIVTNDNFRDHWDNFQWYKDYKNKIEFRILEDKVIFNSSSIETRNVEMTNTGKNIISEPASSKNTLKITPISQMPIDQHPMIISDFQEFLTLLNTNNIDQIFLTQNQFWFMMQGKLVKHQINTNIKITSMEEYLYISKWGFKTQEEYVNWKNLRLEEKGYPNYQAYDKFVKVINLNELPFGDKDSKIYSDISNQWKKVKTKYSINSPPNYEPPIQEEIYWMIWLLAQENGWPSLESVFERYYGLLDPDLLVGYNRGYLELFQYFYSKEISFFQNIKDCSEMRKKIWDSYIKRRINYHDEHDFLSEHNPEYQEIVRKFRNQDLFQESDDETQKTIGQIILWTKAKENGWQSYRELLNIVRKNFSVEFWLSGEDKEKSNDIVNYRRRRRDGSISGSQSSWLISALQGLGIYYKDALNFFAGMSPEDAKSVIVKKEESYIGFYIGSQKIFDTNPNIRRDTNPNIRRDTNSINRGNW